jgi:hypothetical protein
LFITTFEKLKIIYVRLNKIEHAFNLIQEPSNVREILSKDSDFIEWLNLGSIADLNAALDAFQDAQMFEDCVIIQRVLNQKLIRL